MKKSEVVIREVACNFLDGKKKFTQLELSQILGLSISTVNNIVKKLDSLGALRVESKYFAITDFKKLVLFFATHRNLEKDIIYRTRVNMSVTEIENSLPEMVAFTAYTAYVLHYAEAPSDYSEVYFYVDPEAMEEIRARFKERGGPPNVIALKPDEKLLSDIREKRLRESSVCPVQAFADLWNINTWYAKAYLESLEGRLNGVLE